MKNRIAFLSIASVAATLTLVALPVYAQSLDRQLDIGAQGTDVSALQSFLAADSTIYPEGLVTGYYGNLTAAAVGRWQSAHGIDVVGRVGPVTLAALNTAMSNGAVSIVGSPAVPADGSDVSAPVMGPETVTTTSTSATISWVNNESAENSVLYGSSWPFVLGTAPSRSSATFSTTASVTLSGLVPNHTYYYVRQSVDGRGNVQYGISRSFTTSSE